MAALAGSVVAAAAVGYLLATSYLVLRDDLIGAAAARQARMQQAYEDRISMLRAQVDRITSRQMLDQHLVESKVTELLERQAQLTQRHGRISPILDRIGDAKLPNSAPVPAGKPDRQARLGSAATAYASVTGGTEPAPFSSAFWETRHGHSGGESAADQADRLFMTINQSLQDIEEEQIARLDMLAEDAFEKTGRIVEALEEAGLQVDIDEGGQDTGGPLLPVQPLNFDMRVRELDQALSKLETVTEMTKALPIHNPAPGRSVSSTFGIRRDPLIGAPAMHAGMDFRATTGTPVLAAGAGKVIRAGWNGGYGRMVEVEHGDGFTTRYAHMSRIGVKAGESVSTGDVLGKVGSTGRSTGPHLHYEVRRNGEPLDPVRFLKAGRTVKKLMQP
ncbi:M23 family metallopeptidase [Aquamicrobium sp. LC103]|nr:M23 family metallopeptidase [Aquamicrobium sp. LC103]